MSIITGKKVGISNLSVEYSDSQDNTIVNVTAVELYSIDYIQSSIYTGVGQTPDVVVRAKFDDIISEPLIKDVDYSVSYSNNVNPGVANVIVTGIGNYKGTLNGEWYIGPADISFNGDVGIITEYNGLNQSTPINTNDVILVGNQKCTIRYGLSQDFCNLDVCPSVVNVDDSKIIYYEITAPNHNPMIGSYEVTITPTEAILSWGKSSWVYDGESHSVTCIVSNLIGDDTCEVTVLYNSIINIGQVDVYASSLSNNNYYISGGGEWHSITITPGMFYKIGDNWNPVKAVYRKVNGTWVKQEFTNAFSEDENYLKK